MSTSKDEHEAELRAGRALAEAVSRMAEDRGDVWAVYEACTAYYAARGVSQGPEGAERGTA